VLLTQDIPGTYDPDKAIAADDWVQNQLSQDANPESAPIKLPIAMGRKGAWEWLQPYPFPEDRGDGKRHYNAHDVGQGKSFLANERIFLSAVLTFMSIDDGRFRLDPGPYTMVEGFLHLAKPLVEGSSE
jgi:hypothetical protein